MSALILAPPLSSSVAHVRLDDQEQSEGSISDASVEDDVRSVVAPPPRVVSAYASERAYVPEPRLLKSESSRPAPSYGSSAPPAAAAEVTPVRSHSVDKMPAPMPEPIVQPAMVSAPLSFVPAPQYQPLYAPSQQYQPLYAPSQQEYARYEAVDIQYPRVPAYLPPPAYAPPVYQPVAAVSDFKYTPLSSVTPAMPPRAQSVYYPSDLPSDPNHPVFLTPTPPPPRSASVIPGTTLVFSADQRDYGFYQPPVGEPLQLSPADQRLAGFYSLKLPDQRELGFYPKPSPRQQQQPVEEEKKKAATTVGESDDNVEVKECNHRGCQRQGGNGECRRKKRMGALRAAVSKLKGLFSRSPRREKAKEPTEGETTPAK